MSSRKFRFVSPGVFLREIDNSQLPAQNEAIGPVIIGTANQGPAMVPTKIKSLEELEIVFGKSSPGGSLDPWREGTGLLSETHAINAARAYLSAGQGTNSPVTIVRLLGIAGDDAQAGTDGEPGWETDAAYGLFLANKDHAVDENTVCKLSLAGVFYGSGSFIPKAYGEPADGGAAVASANAITGSFFKVPTDSRKLKLSLTTNADNVPSGDPLGERKKTVECTFSDLRKNLNTNPVSTNSNISPVVSGTLAERYWLGETFEQEHKRRHVEITKDTSDEMVYAVLPLSGGAAGMSDFKHKTQGAFAGRTGWVFANASSEDPAEYDPDAQQKLFRIVSLHEGQQSSREMLISIEDVVPPREGSTNVYSSFSVIVKKITSTKVIELERFTNCNLDPMSPNFIGKKIGTQKTEWIMEEKRNRLYGEHPAASSYIRVEMHESFPSNGVQYSVPFGFYGPIRPAKITSTASVDPAGTAEVMRLTIKSTISKDDVDGKTLTIIQSNAGENTTRVFTLRRDDQNGADDINIKDVEGNRAEGIRDAIFAKLTADNQLSDITFEKSDNAGAGDETITATQTNVGDVVTIAIDATMDPTDFDTPEVVTPGVDAGTEIIATVDSWVSDRIKFTGLLNDQGSYEICWPSPQLVETAHFDRGNFLGVSAYSQNFSKDGNGDLVSEDKASIFDGLVDNYRRMPLWEDVHADQESGNANSPNTEYSFKFSLDDAVLVPVAPATQANLSTKGEVSAVTYVSGSRASGDSYTAESGSTSEDLRTLFSIVNGFHMPLDGGSDGTNIIESDPFNERQLESNLTKTSYAYASVDRAIELIKDPEAIEHNIAVMPGISNRTLARKLVETCEARADSLAIIDLPEIYVPPSQRHYSEFKQRLQTTPESSASGLVQEQLNSSYGATYYPWVKIKDTSNGRDVWAPPSVVALGVMANTEKAAEVWFAPAGFNRGGLNQGNAGLPVLQVTEQLLSRDRDTLYQANINPIASFVSEGIVIFGQKTLQSTQSALDRINVRRLLIYVKKEVSKISKNLLFEQNVQATWARFHGQVKPFLESVKVRFGLTDFKIILDSTTTTPDLIDRNIMYAKIFLKPARSIEFIAVDFVITNTGASFADPLE